MSSKYAPDMVPKTRLVTATMRVGTRLNPTTTEDKPKSHPEDLREEPRGPVGPHGDEACRPVGRPDGALAVGVRQVVGRKRREELPRQAGCQGLAGPLQVQAPLADEARGCLSRPISGDGENRFPQPRVDVLATPTCIVNALEFAGRLGDEEAPHDDQQPAPNSSSSSSAVRRGRRAPHRCRPP